MPLEHHEALAGRYIEVTGAHGNMLFEPGHSRLAGAWDIHKAQRWLLGALAADLDDQRDELACQGGFRRARELPASVDAEREAAKLRVLLDGLRVQLVTTPRQTTPEWAVSVLDDYFAALATPSAEAAMPATVDSREG